ncbi:cysteine proteinase inhibitor 5 [Elaeis guineensis]|uniref:Cysteine proteinase inhibitor 5 n=1 Tax=Elaeis guineensis var. tenera TaxID=51953 RepID=A0A6I9RI67_ELAGV|nr:cysteine proteinase inhibitor 5 [Elaeis guineensis]
MASSSCCILFFLLAVASSPTAFQLVGGDGRKVGGRTEVPHVESDKEVQDLGLFCVEEYNQRLHGGRSEALTFLRVVAAERQVVSGIKYYLKIAARDGRERTFDAIVVVKPWLKSRSLLSFTPSAHY